MFGRVSNPTVTRRVFLRSAVAVGASGAVASLLQACAPAAAPVPAPTQAAAKPGAPAVVKGSKITLIAGKSFWPESDDYRDKWMSNWANQYGASFGVDSTTEGTSDAQLASIAETGAGPDFAILQAHHPNVLAKGLADLDDVVEELSSKYGGFDDWGKSVCFVDGHWKALPSWIYPKAWNYREDYLKEAGVDKVPTTYDELLAAAKKLNSFGKPIGCSFGHAATDATGWLYPLLWAFGGKELESDGKTLALDSPETAKAIEYAKEIYPLMIPGTPAWTEVGNNQAFIGGAISMTINVTTIYLAAKRDNTDIAKVMNHAPYTTGPAGNFGYHSVGLYGVFKHSPNLAGAKALLRDWHGPDALSGWLKLGQTYFIPALRDHLKLDWWPNDPKLTLFRTATRNNRLPGYAGPLRGAAASALASYLVVDMFAKAVQGTPTKEAIAWAVGEYKLLLK